MLGILLVPFCFVVIWAVTTMVKESPRILKILAVAYVVRLAAMFVVRDIQFFTHAAGGDSVLYEYLAVVISDYWDHNGLTFVTMEQVEQLGPTALPSNAFALIIYLNGGPTRAGCTAFVAMIACLTCLNFLRLARELGADPKKAERVMTVVLFLPSYVLYTSDMYKDGLVLFVVLGAVGSAIRLTRRLTLVHAAFGLACLYGVWYVRFYLVFLCVIPGLAGLSGLGSRSILRPLLFVLVGIGAFIALKTYTHIFEDAFEIGEDTFNVAHGWRSMTSNQRGGSGVKFDDGGSATGALHLKLLYTIFAPFPWAGGSVGFHIGKLDALCWYYFIYRASIAAKNLFKKNIGLLAVFVTFLVPVTVMYALTMSNVGLVLRQRMPVVVLTMLMATLSWPTKESEEPEEESDEEEASEDAVPELAAGE